MLMILHEVGGVLELGGVHKVLLDGARRDEAVEDGDGARLVVGSRCASTAEGLDVSDVLSLTASVYSPAGQQQHQCTCR